VHFEVVKQKTISTSSPDNVSSKQQRYWSLEDTLSGELVLIVLFSQSPI